MKLRARLRHEAFARLGVTPAIWLNKLALYPTPATWFFGVLSVSSPGSIKV